MPTIPVEHDTIIIGAGVAGLGCAHTLARNKKDFLLITENIGGRIQTSVDGKINYGAYFVLENYDHIMPYVRKGEKLYPFSIDFHDKKHRTYHLIKMFKYPMEVLRFFPILYRFRSIYTNFKKTCATKSQKKVIENDAYIKKLYTQTAEEFIYEKKIQKISGKFLEEGVYMCTFLPLSKVSAFDFLRLCLGLILPAYEFIFLKDKATKHLKKHIIMDSVTEIVHKKNHYAIKTKRGKRYRSRHLVVATPPHISQMLMGTKRVKKPVSAWIFHLSGELKEKWRDGQFELFKSDSTVIFIRRQFDGTYIFYSKVKNPDLDIYFQDSKLIAKKDWAPAFNITGASITECEQGENCYLIGDYNCIGLEDSYITGIYAANKIMIQ